MSSSARHAVVTGASSGIGRSIAESLLAGGWRVSGLDVAQPSIVHPSFIHVPVNLADGADIARVSTALPNVDALVHAAGVLRVGPLGQLDHAGGELMWRLHVDAAARLVDAIEYGKALSQYPLFWYEEAGDPLDYELQAKLGEVYQGPMATGENLFSMQDARNLIRHGGMHKDRDWLQFDCALSYGLVEYLRTLDMLKEYGWSPSRCIPHGGHQMSLAIAAGLGLGGNESYPDLFQPYGGFPDGVKVENGYVTLPPLPGIGFEGKSDLIAEMRALAS